MRPHLSCGLIYQGGLVWVLCHYLGKQGRDGSSVSPMVIHGNSHFNYNSQTPFRHKEEERRTVKGICKQEWTSIEANVRQAHANYLLT